MNLRQALTFVTVAELGTVSKAALRLRIAQPALSRQIIDLERELGLRLFDRVGRRLLLTGEGGQLIAGCRMLLNCASAVKEQAQLLRRGDTEPSRSRARHNTSKVCCHGSCTVTPNAIPRLRSTSAQERAVRY
jgi:DNA-binding transcriptional LysR family regulator